MKIVLKRLCTRHDWVTAFVGVDELSLELHEAHQQHFIQSCDDLGELKEIASALVKRHYAMKRVLGQYMVEGTPRMDG